MSNRFDGDTGIELEQAMLRDLQQDRARLIAEAAALAGMAKTAGWKHLENFINTAIAAHHANLLEERDLDGIRRLQERVKAYANVLSYVEAVIREGEEANQEPREEFETAPEADLDAGSSDQGNP